MQPNQHIKNQLVACAPQPVTERIVYWCNQFMGKPFSFNSCGDAPGTANANDRCFFNFTAFDCVSFVNTVYALAHTTDFAAFKKLYTGLRYIKALSFGGRNHFIEQWYYNNVFQKKYYAPLSYDIFPPEAKQTIRVNVAYSQWIQQRLQKTMEEINTNDGYNIYELKYTLVGYSLAAIFSAVKKSGQKAEQFLAGHSYMAKLQTGDVLIFVSDIMMHLAVVCTGNQLEVYTASSVKNEVTKFGLVYYLQLLYTMRTITHVAIVRDAALM
jgi:hypothetical protein